MKAVVLGKNTNIIKQVHVKLNIIKPVDLNGQTVESADEMLAMVATSNSHLKTVKCLLIRGECKFGCDYTDDKKYDITQPLRSFIRLHTWTCKKCSPCLLV